MTATCNTCRGPVEANTLGYRNCDHCRARHAQRRARSRAGIVATRSTGIPEKAGHGITETLYDTFTRTELLAFRDRTPIRHVVAVGDETSIEEALR